MVVPDSEVMSPGEVESPLQSGQHQSRNNAHNALLPQLGRQSSIYSLTLDEFQHTLCESGKNFGSMNMDEFLNSIWTAEENQAHAQVHPAAATNTSGTATSAAVATNNSGQFFTGNVNNTSGEQNMIVKQLSLPRQGSLTLPGPLSHKTVDEVWSEIQKTQHHHHPSNNNNNNVQIPGSAPRQPTYGEMTLEDFLVKAGVVREQNQLNVPVVAQQPPVQFGLYPNGNNRVSGPPPMIRPVMGGGGGGAAAISAYSPLIREAAGYAGAGKRGGAYQPPPPCYGGMVGNGGYAIGSPVSPVSSDGITTSQLDGGNQYGMDMGGMRGSRKRIIDGPVEKVVERRQRRMIKNRESAARSRARKQAYTVELEAELNMLKEENAQLKQALAEFERKRKQQFYEEMRMKALPKAQKAKEKLRVLRRSLSCPT